MGKRLRSGFYRRGGVIWVRSDPLDRRRKSTGARDPEAAYLWRAERERVVASPVYAASLAASFGDWVVKMLEIKKVTRSAGTLHMYGVKLGHFVRIWGESMSLAGITAHAVDLYVEQRRKERAASNTIARELTCLRQLLRHAKRARQFPGELAEIMPIGFSAEYKPVTRTLKPADFPKLWAALRDDNERAFVALALGFAMDSGDIECARPEDYDPARGVMKVRGTKTASRADEVPVLPHVRELVEWAVARLPVSWSRASKGVGEACRRAGLPHLSPKDLRRSAASWLVAAGADQGHVGRFLRHRGDAMVRKVYGQITAEQLGDLLGVSSRNVTPTTRPLGGIGRRRGFKRRSGGVDSGSGDKGSHTYATGERPATAATGPESSHRESAVDDWEGEWLTTLAEHSERVAAFEAMGGGST